MNLVIDIGNTLTKIALVEDNSIVFAQKAEAFTYKQLIPIIEQYSVHNCILSAVGKADPETFGMLSKKIPVLVFDSETPIPIKNCYTTPQTLGADRLAAAVAANMLHPNNNVLSVDSGTAITYDFVTQSGEYLGGGISPGISLRLKALHHFTQKLPEVPFEKNYPLIGKTTHESILSGVLNGVVSEVDGYINSLREIYGDLVVVFTGGDAIFFEKKLKNSIFVHPNLVILGLNRILNHNAKH